MRQYDLNRIVEAINAMPDRGAARAVMAEMRAVFAELCWTIDPHGRVSAQAR